MKEIQKKFYIGIILWIIGAIAVCIAVSVIYETINGREFTEKIKVYVYDENHVVTDDNLKAELSEDGIVEIKKIWTDGDDIYYTVKGIGKGTVYMSINDVKAGEELATLELSVSSSGVVSSITHGNYSNYKFHLLMRSILITLITVICLAHLLIYNRQLRYSYAVMFVGGLLIWLTCTVVSQWYAFLKYDSVYNYYGALKQSGFLFILYTAPIVIIFCIALTISNISLIRHERLRMTNILGIIISALLLGGSILALLIGNIGYSGDETGLHIYNIAVSTYTTAYSVFASLLEGAIIGGIIAAKNVPDMDMDYIIILGCMIRKDGSLTPLLKGRADRAIKHGRCQEEATGKKAVFVPSGGQGSNEVMAEADAIKNYLLSQGIPEDRILVENQSKNTAQNMAFSKKLIDSQMENAKIAFSTTNYHVFRSGIIATQNGFIAEGMGSKTKWYFWPNAFMREYIGMMSYTKKAIIAILVILVLGFVGAELFL